MSKRDPFPFPRRQNDNDFMLNDPQNPLSKTDSPKAKGTPFDHLYNSKTLSSQNREWSRAICHTPPDKLDAALGADYDHHLHFNKDSAEAFKHRDSVQQELVASPSISDAVKANKDGKAFSHPEKESIDHARGLAIVGPHIYATNRGYSRKPDGQYVGNVMEKGSIGYVRSGANCRALPFSEDEAETARVDSEVTILSESREEVGLDDSESCGSLISSFQSLWKENESDLKIMAGNVKHYRCRYPEYGQQSQPGQLIFNANFESGNLGRVQFVTDCEYDLYLRSDTCNPSYRIWFNFTVSNVRENQKVIFNIVNYSRERSLHREGMGPVVWSTSNPHWERLPSHLVFFYRCPELRHRYVLTFLFQFPRPGDLYQFSYSFPYTYSRLTSYLKQLCALEHNYLHVERLCTSIQRRDTHILTISSPANLLSSRQCMVFITGRIHPGESPSSFVCQGLIEFLVSQHPAALALREALVFKIVPMLNPDGVALGNYRCSLMGEDLNRHWQDPSPFIHPTLYHTKQLLHTLDNDSRVRLDFYIDIHAHSTLTNGFMYGNVFEDKTRFERQLRFPKLLSIRASDFSWSRTIFDKNAVKAGTGRRCLGNSLNKNTLCYTMEVSLFSYTTHSQQQKPYTEGEYGKLGKNIALALLDYYKLKT